MNKIYSVNAGYEINSKEISLKITTFEIERETDKTVTFEYDKDKNKRVRKSDLNKLIEAPAKASNGYFISATTLDRDIADKLSNEAKMKVMNWMIEQLKVKKNEIECIGEAFNSLSKGIV